MTIKAKLIKPQESDKIGRLRDKPLERQITILDRDTGRDIVTCRIYWPGSVAYCALWIHGSGVHASGTGKAGGYGYCKESSAIHSAIYDAGFTLSENVAGRGTAAAYDALEAVAACVTGKRKFYRVLAHA
jgi:hypothetical protein